MHSASVALHLRILMWVVGPNKTWLYDKIFSTCSQNTADVFRPVVRLNGLELAFPFNYLI